MLFCSTTGINKFTHGVKRADFVANIFTSLATFSNFMLCKLCHKQFLTLRFIYLFTLQAVSLVGFLKTVFNYQKNDIKPYDGHLVT